MSHAFQDVPLLLATGQGRSGTTVLTKALAEHPAVFSNRVESNVMKDVLLAGRASSTVPSRVRQMVLDRAQHDLVFRRLLLELLFPIDRWTRAESPLRLSTFSAMNPEAAEFAVSVFPGIHFANIVRHGIEVVASRMVHRSLGQHSFSEHCQAWAAAREMAAWGASRGDFTLIRHEQLLDQESLKRTFENLLQRAGLPDHPACRDYVWNHRFNQTRYDQETEDSQTDLARRRQRWNLWTTEQQQTFLEFCGPALEFFGYALPE